MLGQIALLGDLARLEVLQGVRLARLTSGKADDDPFPRPEAMTVNGRGEILVYDQRRAGIVVFR